MTAYDSIERGAADVVERRHRRTLTLTQLLVACVAACCCALAATTVRSTHHEGWGLLRRVRRAPPRPVYFRGPSADERLKTCESDLKAQKDENEKRTTELKKAFGQAQDVRVRLEDANRAVEAVRRLILRFIPQ